MKIRPSIVLLLSVAMMVFGFIFSIDSNRLAGVAMIIGGSLIICAILISEAIIKKNGE